MNNSSSNTRNKKRPSTGSNNKNRRFNSNNKPKSATSDRSRNNGGAAKSKGKPDRRHSRGNKPKQGPSKLDPILLVKKAVFKEVKDFRAERLFSDTPLDDKLKLNLKNKGFERPSEIQEHTLEYLIEGNDLLGIAQTGTGKTGAFLIPIVEKLIHKRIPSEALIVVPTRELALQVEDEFKSLTKGLNLKSAVFIGGTNINKDLRTARSPINVIIGTPGRLLDLSDRRALDFRKINTLVLDEFDRMLDMGFVNDVKKMISLMKNRSQTLLFSATIDKKQQYLIDEILNNPKVVKVSSGEASSDHIDQDVIRLNKGEDKFKHLCNMLNQSEFEKVLIFDEAKHRVNRLSVKLNSAGFKTDAIHGNKTQSARQNALERFKKGKVNILCATDVAARGIDVDDITHVINFQIPMTYDSYIHRIGRTGRAGKVGKAFTYIEN